jgi:hypothetical protein
LYEVAHTRIRKSLSKSVGHDDKHERGTTWEAHLRAPIFLVHVLDVTCCRRGTTTAARTSSFHPPHQACLEALGLLDVKDAEVAELGVGFESVQGLRHGVAR